MEFLLERAKGLISKKIGAAVIGETAIAGTAPDMQGVPTIVYLVIQGLVDAVKSYADAKFAASA